MNIKSGLFGLALALLFIPTCASAHSQNDGVAIPAATPEARGPVFAIFPLESTGSQWFSAELNPGETVNFVVVVGTLESSPVVLRVFPANVFNLPNGGFGAGSHQEERIGAAAWIDFPDQIVDLEGTQQIEIPFSVTVPPDAQAGEYVAALVAQTADTISVEGSTMIDFLPRSAVAVVITVPGEFNPSFRLGDPEIVGNDGVPSLVVPIENTGNVLVRPEGSVTITSPDGTLITNAQITMGSVYAGNATTIDIALPEQFAAGDYVVSASLTDQGSGYEVIIEDTTLTYSPGVDAAPPDFLLDPLTISPVGDPVQFADVSITIGNSGEPIPTANVVLAVSKDGDFVEEYLLAQNLVVPQDILTISQRYIPATGWESGEYTFVIEVWSVDESGTETVIATVEVEDTIEIP